FAMFRRHSSARSPNELTRRYSEPRPAPMHNFTVASSSSLRPRAHSGAVADLVSRWAYAARRHSRPDQPRDSRKRTDGRDEGGARPSLRASDAMGENAH